MIIWKELEADGTDASDIQITLKKLEEWADRNEMQFNADKTQAMAISRLRKKSFPSIFFQNCPLTPQPSLRYLGIQIDDRLLMNHHVNQIRATALRRLTQMKVIASTYFGSRPAILRQLVRGAILPVLTYAIEAWGFRLAVNSIRNTLDRIIRLCSIWIIGALLSSPTFETIYLAGLTYSKYRYQELLLCSAYFAPRKELEHVYEDRRTMTLAPKPIYTSGKLELQEELRARIQAGLKPPWSFSKYSEWKDEIRLCLLQEQEQLWQQSQPSVGRKTFLW